jgi:hypothetical protein
VGGAVRGEPNQVALAHLGEELGRDRIHHGPSEIHLSTVPAAISVISVGGRKNFRKRDGGTVIMRSLVSAMNLDGSVSKLWQWPRRTPFSYQI